MIKFALVSLVVIVIGLGLMYVDYRVTFGRKSSKGRVLRNEKTKGNGKTPQTNSFLPGEAE